jgi:hypothetical protein
VAVVPGQPARVFPLVAELAALLAAAAAVVGGLLSFAVSDRGGW